MHFLNLVEAITKNLTADNVSLMVTLVENLITVAESIKTTYESGSSVTTNTTTTAIIAPETSDTLK